VQSEPRINATHKRKDKTNPGFFLMAAAATSTKKLYVKNVVALAATGKKT